MAARHDRKPVPGAARRRPAQPLTLKGLWHSRRMRGLIVQLLAIVGVVGVVAIMGSNAARSLSARGMETGFGFLGHEAGFSMAESLWPFSPSDTFLDAFAAGLGNTLWVSFVSLIFATVFGVLLGIARLSPNWLLGRITAGYVEVFRNTPQLIQIVFWYTLFTLLPGARQALHGGDWWFLSNRGLVLAWPTDRQALAMVLFALGLAILLVSRIMAWVDRYNQRTGGRLHAGGVALGFVILLPFTVWLSLAAPASIDFPELAGFNFRGGITLSPEFLALALGLVLYFAAYISEIVRSGIQSVTKGQIEAGRAIGLRGFELYRRIIMPQALRVIVPPLTAQYISLVKTSALGVAIGYPELFNVSNSIMTLSGHTLECVFIMGAVYLALAVIIAAIMNGFNRLVALRGVIAR